MSGSLLHTTAAFHPPSPRQSADTGLSRGFLSDLILKTFYYRSDLIGHELTRLLYLPFAVIEGHLEQLRREKLIEVKGAEGMNLSSYRFTITQMGRDRAREVIKISQYVGPAPVTLEDYTKGICAQTSLREPVNADTLRANLSHLVLAPDVVQQIGPALNSQRSLFLHGEPGNGKTVMAEAIGKAMGGYLMIPHAIEVDNQVIKVLDPIFHGEPEAGAPAAGDLGSLDNAAADQRWVRVRRPVVFAGGELTLDMLDLNFNEREGFYEAPLQMKANAGVFIIDDFGRQQVRPRDLLNRWIVPLDKGVDFLSLHTGRKFPIPFSAMVVFATNLNPRELVDEAFLRRIRYKVEVGPPPRDNYAMIFARECRLHNVRAACDPIEYLYKHYYDGRGIPVRACHPRDILEKIVEAARYDGSEPMLTDETLDRVCRSYFLV